MKAQSIFDRILAERRMKSMGEGEHLKGLRQLGFAPYAIVLHEGYLREIISYPYMLNEKATIKIRGIIGDPTSMLTVDCSEIKTAEMYAKEQVVSQEMADFLVAVGQHMRTHGIREEAIEVGTGARATDSKSSVQEPSGVSGSVDGRPESPPSQGSDGVSM